MIYLLIVSLIWAFSFGLIKGNLTGLDSNFVSYMRLLISLLVFAPFVRIQNIGRNHIWRLIAIGAIQYGAMYATYIYAFQYLKAFEIAVFTIFTPLYVTLLNDSFHRKFATRPLLMALVAVIGTGVIVYTADLGQATLIGFLLIQCSNMAFAVGQIWYREVMRQLPEKKDVEVFGLLYSGGVLLTGILTALTTDLQALEISATQWYTLLYLGVIASGLGFFLWNLGARKVSAGTLAVFNNVKVPLAVAVSLIFFGESTDLLRLVIGSLLIATALYVEQKRSSDNEANASHSGGKS